MAAFATSYTDFIGDKTAIGILTSTLIVSGSGRCVSFTVNAAGGAVGTIHDAATVAGATVDNIIGTIPMAVTSGTVALNVPFTNGLVVKPGSSHNICIVYS